MRKCLVAMMLVLAGGFLLAPNAGAAFIAETTDPAGDSTSSHPGRDLRGAGIGFDQKTGFMVAVIALHGSPSDDGGSFLTIYAGMRTASGCNGYPAGGFGAMTDGWDAIWVRHNAPGQTQHGEADKSGYRSNVQRFEVETRKLAGRKWNCLTATLTDPENPEIVYDQIGTVAFRGLPSLRMNIQKVRRAVPVNRTRRIKVVVANPGDAPLRGASVRFAGDRGLKVWPRKRRLGVIRPGKRRAVFVRVKPRMAAGTSADLKVTVKAGKLVARSTRTFKVKQPRRKPSGGGGGSFGGSGVCVQYFPDLSGETGGSLGMVPC